jgi:hypothetical protein
LGDRAKAYRWASYAGTAAIVGTVLLPLGPRDRPVFGSPLEEAVFWFGILLTGFSVVTYMLDLRRYLAGGGHAISPREFFGLLGGASLILLAAFLVAAALLGRL